MYDNIIESTSRFEHSNGFGCILAHSMGLGKTLQLVAFSDIFLRHTPGEKSPSKLLDSELKFLDVVSYLFFFN